MSYTRPSASAADATWLGAAAYTRPAQSAADATWVQGAGYVAGWNHTTFGSPSNAPNAVGFSSVANFGTALGGNFQRALGFSSTPFGTPGVVGAQLPSSPFASFGIGTIPLLAEGWSSTAFGGPDTPLFATGAIHTVFGDSQIIQFWQHRGPAPATRFGTPYIQQDAVLDATGAPHTRFGRAFAAEVVELEANWVTQAAGFKPVAFGSPSTDESQSVRAFSTRHTVFGVPTASTAMFGVVARFGLPRVNVGLFAVGAVPGTAAGLPRSGTSGEAKAVRATQFGAAVGGRACAAQGTLRTQFGVGSVRYGFSALASGAQHGRFGTTSAHCTYRALRAAPGTRFGRPSLVRGTEC